MLHATAALFAALTLVLIPAAAEPDPILQYEGTITAMETPEEIEGEGGVGTPAVATLDCSADPCTLTGAVNNGDTTVGLTGQGPLPFNGTTQTYSVPAIGDICANTYSSPGELTVTRVGNTLEIVRSGTGSEEVDCGDSSVQYLAYTATIVVTLVSGDLCTIDDTCSLPADDTSTPTASPVSAGDDAEVIPGAPSTLSTLPTVAEAINPLNLLWAAGAATVLILLVALPSQLVNSTVDKLSERGGTRLGKLPLTGWPIAAAGVLVAAIASTFIEPDAVFDLRVFASVLIAFLLDAVLGWFAVIWLVRRSDSDAKPTFRVLPIMLLLVIVAVLFSRFTGFQPGLMFGLVAGVVFGSLASGLSRARVVLFELGWAFGLALLAWIAYSLIPPDIVFLRETLAAVSIGGIAALPVALLPVPGLAGRTVWNWNKPVWAISYALGLVGFFLVLMPRPFAWDSVDLSIWVWGAIFVAYAIAAVVLWLLVVKPWVRPSEHQEPHRTADPG
jgi:hypothetical protein